MSRDIDSPDYCEHNLGDERDTPEEKEIERLRQKLAQAEQRGTEHAKEIELYAVALGDYRTKLVAAEFRLKESVDLRLALQSDLDAIRVQRDSLRAELEKVTKERDALIELLHKDPNSHDDSPVIVALENLGKELEMVKARNAELVKALQSIADNSVGYGASVAARVLRIPRPPGHGDPATRGGDGMMPPISFWISGVPKPAGSKRAFVIKKGGHYTSRAIVTDANPNSRDWKIDVQHAAKDHCKEVWECPIRLVLVFLIARPKGHYRSGKNSHLLRDTAPPFPTGKPDSTKLCRGVEDALTGIAWKDDAQIVTQHICKRYGEPGVRVEIYEEVP